MGVWRQWDVLDHLLAAPIKDIQPVGRGDPECSVALFKGGGDHIAAQTLRVVGAVLITNCLPSRGVKPDQPSMRGQPKHPRAVLADVPNPALDSSSQRWVVTEGLRCRIIALEIFIGRNPKFSGAVFE